MSGSLDILEVIHKHPIEKSITYEGIHKWYRSVFKRAGWMLLALRDGYDDKIKSYITELEHLLNSINEKGRKIVEEDRKEDLRIIFKNVVTLYEHMKLMEK